MRFVRYQTGWGRATVGLVEGDMVYPLAASSLTKVIAKTDRIKEFRRGDPVPLEGLKLLTPIARPEKILCIGVNYFNHASEMGRDKPDYPVVFARYANTLVAPNATLVKPTVSDQMDYEGELAIVIAKPIRNATREQALAAIGGYSIFNDVSIRDYQFKSPQWTMGKNFDNTGAFGPYLVTPDDLPEGAKGLSLKTRLNGELVQDGNTSDMMFDVVDIIMTLSEAMTLKCGDIIATGTPAGVGVARDPQLFMKPGDVVEVEIEGIGTLRNTVG